MKRFISLLLRLFVGFPLGLVIDITFLLIIPVAYILAWPLVIIANILWDTDLGVRSFKEIIIEYGFFLTKALILSFL